MRPKTLKRISIKGGKWKIKREAIEDLMGETNFNEKTIRLHPDLEGRNLRVTFWHEFIHALFGELYIRVGDTVEDIIADNVATALDDIMTNELTKYTLEVENE